MPSPGPQELRHSKKKETRSDVSKVRSVLGRLGGAAGKKHEADWGEALPENVSAIVCIVTRLGGLVTFGRSRDKAVLSVNVYIEGEKTTKWLDGDSELDEQLGNIIQLLAGLEEEMRG